MSNPTPGQRTFFDVNLSKQPGTVLTLKLGNVPISVNIRGPFHLIEYVLGGQSQTVIDTVWAGPPESNAHMHCDWRLVHSAVLGPTSTAVQNNIKHNWQLTFRDQAKQALFWFYLEDDTHVARKNLQVGQEYLLLP